MRNLAGLVFAVFFCLQVYAQDNISKYKGGMSYGIGNEIKNTDYTYTNQYIKAQFYYTFKKTKNFEFELIVQPEINFATHQLMNLYFVTPDEPNFEEKREVYTRLKDITEYVFTLGAVCRYPFAEKWSIYAVLSVGPMITDTETERLSKGFSFCDVLGIGITYKINNINLDFRPNVRHTSNAGLQNSNAGFNTLNVEFGVNFGF